MSIFRKKKSKPSTKFSDQESLSEKENISEVQRQHLVTPSSRLLVVIGTNKVHCSVNIDNDKLSLTDENGNTHSIAFASVKGVESIRKSRHKFVVKYYGDSWAIDEQAIKLQALDSDLRNKWMQFFDEISKRYKGQKEHSLCSMNDSGVLTDFADNYNRPRPKSSRSDYGAVLNNEAERKWEEERVKSCKTPIPLRHTYDTSESRDRDGRITERHGKYDGKTIRVDLSTTLPGRAAQPYNVDRNRVQILPKRISKSSNDISRISSDLQYPPVYVNVFIDGSVGSLNLFGSQQCIMADSANAMFGQHNTMHHSQSGDLESMSDKCIQTGSTCTVKNED